MRPRQCWPSCRRPCGPRPKRCCCWWKKPGPEHDPGERRLLLGLYEGVPLVDRHADSLLVVPDRITLFRRPLQSLARTEVELRQRVRRTLIHELAHFFGRDEDELAARGWA